MNGLSVIATLHSTRQSN